MNLKEAFRYQKFLTGLYLSIDSYLTRPGNAVTTIKHHMPSKVLEEKQDFDEEVTDHAKKYQVSDVLALLDIVMIEKEIVTTAIAKAKRALDTDLDAELEINRFRQSVARTFSNLLARNAEKKVVQKEQGYVFNVEGNQVPFYYDVEVETTEDFDRDAVNQSRRDYSGEADASSTGIDELMLRADVAFVPHFNVNDKFDDVMETFLKEG